MSGAHCATESINVTHGDVACQAADRVATSTLTILGIDPSKVTTQQKTLLLSALAVTTRSTLVIYHQKQGTQYRTPSTPMPGLSGYFGMDIGFIAVDEWKDDIGTPQLPEGCAREK